MIYYECFKPISDTTSKFVFGMVNMKNASSKKEVIRVKAQYQNMSNYISLYVLNNLKSKL